MNPLRKWAVKIAGHPPPLGFGIKKGHSREDIRWLLSDTPSGGRLAYPFTDLHDEEVCSVSHYDESFGLDRS
jgi:hypothetical protein